MSRRWIINFGLFTLILLFSYIGNKYGVKTGYQSDNLVLSLKASDISQIRIQTQDLSLEFTRNAKVWDIQQPIRWPANNISIGRVLSITLLETDSRLSANEIDLAKIGLQFPKAILHLGETSILFGATNNIGNRRYLLVDKTVYLVDDIHLPFINQGLSGFVDRRLLPKALELVSLKLADFSLIRSNTQDWEVAQPNGFFKQPPSNQQLSQLINNWQDKQATRVTRFNATATPIKKIIAKDNNGLQHDFFLMSISPHIIIANPAINLQYHFDQGDYYQLLSLKPTAQTDSLDENSSY